LPCNVSLVDRRLLAGRFGLLAGRLAGFLAGFVGGPADLFAGSFGGVPTDFVAGLFAGFATDFVAGSVAGFVDRDAGAGRVLVGAWTPPSDAPAAAPAAEGTAR